MATNNNEFFDALAALEKELADGGADTSFSGDGNRGEIKEIV